MTDSDIYQIVGEAYCAGLSEGMRKQASSKPTASNAAKEGLISALVGGNSADKLPVAGIPAALAPLKLGIPAAPTLPKFELPKLDIPAAPVLPKFELPKIKLPVL